MTRKHRLSTSSMYHIYNRGVSKRRIFFNEKDYFYFMYKMAIFKKKYFIRIITFCLMPNHFHLLLYTEDVAINISKFMKSLQISYAFYFNRIFKHSGHVFESKFQNKVISASDMPKLIYYIEQNPVKEKLVKSPGKWPYRG